MRLLKLLTSMVAVGALLLFASVALRADPAPLARLTPTESGGGIIEVFPGDAEQVMDDLGHLLGNSKWNLVWVEPTPGRAEVSGRLLPDGEGMVGLDHDRAFDNSASRIELSASAEGPILVVVPAEPAGPQALSGLELECLFAGRRYEEVAPEANEMGYDVRVVEGLGATPAGPDAWVRQVLTSQGDAIFVLVPTRDESLDMVDQCEQAERTPTP